MYVPPASKLWSDCLLSFPFEDMNVVVALQVTLCMQVVGIVWAVSNSALHLKLSVCQVCTLCLTFGRRATSPIEHWNAESRAWESSFSVWCWSKTTEKRIPAQKRLGGKIDFSICWSIPNFETPWTGLLTARTCGWPNLRYLPGSMDSPKIIPQWHTTFECSSGSRQLLRRVIRP